jgi:hypothetical protein
MKKVIIAVIGLFLMTLINASNAAAQGVYDLRLMHQSLDCAKKKVVVSVEIKATSADSAFKLEGANVRVRFTSNQLKNPRFKTRDNFSGGMYEVMDSLISMTTDSTSGIFTANIVNAKSATDGMLVGATWTKMFSLEFDVAASNADNCYTLMLMSTLPSSKVTKIMSAGVAVVAAKGVYTNITNQCAVKPVVALSAAAGQTTELILTLQAGDLPVTVTLSGGLSATMTQGTAKVAIAPTVQTTYTITKVENQCAVGLSAAGAGSVTVSPSATTPPDPSPTPISDCANVKCIPVTAKVIKL